MKDILDLFNTLHACPEESMHEHNTMQIIKTWLTVNTTLEVHDMENFVYARHFEGDGYETVAFRADMDAILNKSGKLFHGCGHDGHTGILCRLAMLTCGKKYNKNIIFIFQPAEENGQGAKIIAPYLKKWNVSRIYGCHNIPGFKEGCVLIKKGTFACTSKGITLHFMGRQSHAAYPENGINPSFAIAEVINSWNDITDGSSYMKKILATIINVSVGEKNAFGVNAGYGELSVTIRAELEHDLISLQNRLTDVAQTVCDKYGISLSIECFDEFPETFNPDGEVDRALSIFSTNNIPHIVLDSPMRWSEDFGHYLKETNGMFIGIGAGEHHPDLHTDKYTFNTNIIESAARIFEMLI